MTNSLFIRGQKNQGPADGWPDLVSSLCFTFTDFKPQENWLQYSINFETPTKQIQFNSKNFVFCKQPTNELIQLRDELEAFLNSNTQTTYRFEPVEPNIELMLEKDLNDTIKLYCWIDNGNADCSYYTWDAVGLRLFTNKQLMQNFLSELNQLIQSI
jgi:hypothetical protein